MTCRSDFWFAVWKLHSAHTLRLLLAALKKSLETKSLGNFEYFNNFQYMSMTPCTALSHLNNGSGSYLKHNSSIPNLRQVCTIIITITIEALRQPIDTWPKVFGFADSTNILPSMEGDLCFHNDWLRLDALDALDALGVHAANLQPSKWGLQGSDHCDFPGDFPEMNKI